MLQEIFKHGIDSLAATGRTRALLQALRKPESRSVDRRELREGRLTFPFLVWGWGAAFMDAFEHRLEAGHALLESALAKAINYWDTGQSYGSSESMIAPVFARNRSTT